MEEVKYVLNEKNIKQLTTIIIMNVILANLSKESVDPDDIHKDVMKFAESNLDKVV